MVDLFADNNLGIIIIQHIETPFPNPRSWISYFGERGNHWLYVEALWGELTKDVYQNRLAHKIDKNVINTNMKIYYTWGRKSMEIAAGGKLVICKMKPIQMNITTENLLSG